MSPDPPPRDGAFVAYAMSGLTMVLWVACVLPAGQLAEAAAEDVATPLYREAWLLVPAMLLLIIAPVGVVLSTTRTGRLAVLALADAFIAGYAGLGLLASGFARIDLPAVRGLPGVEALLATTFAVLPAVLVGLLLALSFLSLYEVVRVLRGGGDARVPRLFKGIRLAICLLVLITPTYLLVLGERELGNLLVPFALVAVSASGAAFAQRPLSLRLTASLVHLALALHVLITLRYTIYEAEPAFATVSAIGKATLGIAGGVVFLAVVQVLWLWRLRRALGPAPIPATMA